MNLQDVPKVKHPVKLDHEQKKAGKFSKFRNHVQKYTKVIRAFKFFCSIFQKHVFKAALVAHVFAKLAFEMGNRFQKTIIVSHLF